MGAVDPSSGTAITVDFVCLGISLIFLLLRLYTRVHILNTFSIPDLLILISWLFFFANCIVDQLSAVKYGLWNPGIRYDGINLPKFEDYITDPDLLVAGLKLRYGTVPFYYFVVYGIKVSFLIMYKEMIPRDMKWLRRAMWATVGIVAVGFVLGVALNLGWCQPVSKNWALTSKDRCLSWAEPASFFFVNIFNILSDLLVYILPFFLLPRLWNSATRGQFIGIVAMFSLGALCIACTLGKLMMIGHAATWPLAACWFAAEQACAVIVACCPAFKWIICTPNSAAMPTIPFYNPNRNIHRPSDIESRHIAAAARGKETSGGGMITKSKAMLTIKAVVGRVKDTLSPRAGSFPRSPNGDVVPGESLMLGSAASSLRSPSRGGMPSPPHDLGDSPAPPHTFFNSNMQAGTIITTTIERPQTSDNELYLPEENRDLILNGLAPRRRSELVRGADEVPFTPTVDSTNFDKFLMAKRMSALSHMSNNRASLMRPVTSPMDPSQTGPPPSTIAETTSVTSPTSASVLTSPKSLTEPKKARKRAFTGGGLAPAALAPPKLTANGQLARDANEVPFTPTVTIDLSGELKKATRRVFTGALLGPRAIKTPGGLTLNNANKSDISLAVTADSTQAQPFTPVVDSVGMDEFILGKRASLRSIPAEERRNSASAVAATNAELLPPAHRLSTHSAPAQQPAPPTLHLRQPSRTTAVSTPSGSEKDPKEDNSAISTPLSTSTDNNHVFATRTTHLTVPGMPPRTPDTPATPDTALLFAPFTPMSSTSSNPPPTPSDFRGRSVNSSPESKKSGVSKRTQDSDNTLGIWGRWRRNSSGTVTPSATTPMADTFASSAQYNSPNTPTLTRRSSGQSNRSMTNSKTDLGVLTFGCDETEDVIMEEAFGVPRNNSVSTTASTSTSTLKSRGSDVEYRLSSGPPPIPERKPGSGIMTPDMFTPGMVPMPTMASVAAKHSSNAGELRRKASTRSAKLAVAAAAAAQAQKQKDVTAPAGSPVSPTASGSTGMKTLASAVKDDERPESYGSSIFGTSV